MIVVADSVVSKGIGAGVGAAAGAVHLLFVPELRVTG